MTIATRAHASASVRTDGGLLEVLVKNFHYNAQTGDFTRIRRIANRSKVGEVAGSLNKNGYIQIRVGGKKRQAHRLAWLAFYEVIPATDVDHINGVRSDNRITNLRLATNSQNKANSKLPKNSTTGFKGVSLTYRKGTCVYKAAIRRNGIDTYLGYFRTAEEAHSAYYLAAKDLFGEYARAS